MGDFTIDGAVSRFLTCQDVARHTVGKKGSNELALELSSVRLVPARGQMGSWFVFFGMKHSVHDTRAFVTDHA